MDRMITTSKTTEGSEGKIRGNYKGLAILSDESENADFLYPNICDI